MPKAELTGLLQRLREHLPEHETSPTQQALLNTIQDHIHSEGDIVPNAPTLTETVTLLLNDIELEHPKSAAIANNILQALSSMGI